MNPSAAEAASPASFQPLKAQTSIGSLSSGRSLQTTSVIPITVPNPGGRHTRTVRHPIQDRLDDRGSAQSPHRGGAAGRGPGGGHLRLLAQGSAQGEEGDRLPRGGAPRPDGGDRGSG